MFLCNFAFTLSKSDDFQLCYVIFKKTEINSGYIAATLYNVHCPALWFTVLHCPALSCFTVLQCDSLACSVLNCASLPCTVLQCASLPCTVLHWPALSCNVIHCPSLWFSALHCPSLACTGLHCPALRFTALHWPALSCTVIHWSALPCTGTRSTRNPNILFICKIIHLWRSLCPTISLFSTRICKHLRCPGIDSASLCSLAGRSLIRVVDSWAP